ncbi:Oidioi.mRNA.OKI2018_I69.PAR.g10754.t1.cds [Oikopleura dioica]|uniref:Oidioi.mRNA.OKI2018_I69.PAR.g10754.t1.cds n=1 Tax=Oikopleura dioica TaxID=34765 RepID=A0ABN7RS83_OIKDI|nr:Oidioi.mRNA.OKI2018_I69.PAR.g10754.t1.cds [Oikopleura dioica]
MNLIPTIVFIFATFCDAFPAFNRANTRPVQLYARTGHFMDVNAKGKVRQTHKHNRLTSLLHLEPAGRGHRILLRALASGKYLTITRRGRVRGTTKRNEATEFVEERIKANNFLSFGLPNTNCKLMVSQRGYEISCNNSRAQRNKISFLAMRSHLPRALYDSLNL